MQQVLIAYPDEFLCQAKFFRKVKKIISTLDSPELIFFRDSNSLSEAFANSRGISARRLDRGAAIDSATHAIVFDDGALFPDLLSALRRRGIPLREIRIKITRVINIRDNPDVVSLKNSAKYGYSGRGSYWGNPYSMYDEGETREDVIRKFEYDFENDNFPKKKKSEVYRLHGKTLGCFCKPLPCHGDVLARFLNSWDDGE